MFYLVTALGGLLLVVWATARNKEGQELPATAGRFRRLIRTIRARFETALKWGLFLGVVLLIVRVYTMVLGAGNDMVLAMLAFVAILTLSNTFVVTAAVFIVSILVSVWRTIRRNWN